MLCFNRDRWTGGSTGPPLPKFIGFFLSTSHEFCRSVLELYECILGICLAMHNQSLMIIGWCWWLPTTLDHFFQGVVVGALLNMPLSDRQGLWIIDFLKSQVNVISSDACGRTSIPDCSVSCPISWTSFPLSDFRLKFIFWSRWIWKDISGWRWRNYNQCL